MAATLISSLISQARVHLKEASASYWTDAELLSLGQKSVNDLWGAVIDLHQEHYITVDVTNVTQATDATSLSGVPTDVFRVLLIEPRDTTSVGTHRNTLYIPKDYNSPEFIAARAAGSQDPLNGLTNGLTIYYAVTQAGSPIGAPTILVAPPVTTTLDLRFVYIPGPASASLLTSSSNPIPGESDQAIIAWIVAFARAKEREDRSPDPNWLMIYQTEKQNLLTRLTPRQEQEPEVVDGMFDYMW